MLLLKNWKVTFFWLSPQLETLQRQWMDVFGLHGVQKSLWRAQGVSLPSVVSHLHELFQGTLRQISALPFVYIDACSMKLTRYNYLTQGWVITVTRTGSGVHAILLPSVWTDQFCMVVK